MTAQQKHIHKTTQVDLLQKIILENEKEKEAISYELHENFAQLLAAVKLHLKIAKKHMTSEGVSYTEEAESILLQSLTGIKSLARSISPMTLKSLGFKYLISELFTFLADQKEINFHLSIDEKKVSETGLFVQHLFYQVAQLQLVHLLKIDDACTVIFTVATAGEKLKMKIQHDGSEEINDQLALIPGLSALKEKTEAFDGTFNIYNTPDLTGVTLEVIL